MTYCIVDDETGESVVIGSDGEGRKIPRYISWSDLPSLPIDLSEALCSYANKIEYHHSADYDRAMGLDFEKALPMWLPHAARSFGVEDLDVIIDYATGTGVARLALMKGGFCRVLGIDLSSDCLDRQHDWTMKLKLNANRSDLLTVSQLEERIPELIGKVRLIVISSGLHHIPDIKSFFSLSERLLAPGGQLYCVHEPCNKSRYHGWIGQSNQIDLFEVAIPMVRGELTRSMSTLMMAEFWDGRGFSRQYMAETLKKAGLELERWENGSWLSYVFHHHLRHQVAPDRMADYDQLYKDVCDLDDRIKNIFPNNVVEENVLSVSILARKPKSK